jgi:hypothetical protein
VHVRGSVAKQTRRDSDARFVPINDPLHAWLSKYIQGHMLMEHSRVIPISVRHFSQRLRAVFAKADVASGQWDAPFGH